MPAPFPALRRLARAAAGLAPQPRSDFLTSVTVSFRCAAAGYIGGLATAFGRKLLAATVVLSIASLAWAEDEIEVGRNASGQFVLQIEFEQPLILPVSVFPGIPGYATGAVGLHSAIF